MSVRDDRLAEARRLAAIRTREQAERAYADRFGGFPSYLLMGAPDERVVGEVRHALRTGRAIRAAEPGADY